jgi:hypothetical protein
MPKRFFTKAITIIAVCIFCSLVKGKTALGKAEIEICKKKLRAKTINFDDNQKVLYSTDGFFIKI